MIIKKIFIHVSQGPWIIFSIKFSRALLGDDLNSYMCCSIRSVPLPFSDTIQKKLLAKAIGDNIALWLTGARDRQGGRKDRTKTKEVTD